MSKLDDLVEIEGYDSQEDLLEAATADSVVPGICMSPGCNYTTGVEPDCREGWCEECNKNTVKSCLIIAGMI